MYSSLISADAVVLRAAGVSVSALTLAKAATLRTASSVVLVPVPAFTGCARLISCDVSADSRLANISGVSAELSVVTDTTPSLLSKWLKRTHASITDQF